jgi:CTP:molybdopterin cytidylyltransferase MocA
MPDKSTGESSAELTGILLAAGAGRRMGGPKALLVDPDGRSLLARAVDVLLAGGCDSVTVVLGAEADRVTAMLSDELPLDDRRLQLVVTPDWAAGQGASLRAGLAALTAAPGSVLAAMVMLVDLPGVGSAAIDRIASYRAPEALVRASYCGHPGHPVLLGRDHWTPVRASLDPAHGARDYLATHSTVSIACDDVADGRDVDRPGDAATFELRWSDVGVDAHPDRQD